MKFNPVLVVGSVMRLNILSSNAFAGAIAADIMPTHSTPLDLKRNILERPEILSCEVTVQVHSEKKEFLFTKASRRVWYPAGHYDGSCIFFLNHLTLMAMSDIIFPLRSHPRMFSSRSSWNTKARRWKGPLKTLTDKKNVRSHVQRPASGWPSEIRRSHPP